MFLFLLFGYRYGVLSCCYIPPHFFSSFITLKYLESFDKCDTRPAETQFLIYQGFGWKYQISLLQRHPKVPQYHSLNTQKYKDDSSREKIAV